MPDGPRPGALDTVLESLRSSPAYDARDVDVVLADICERAAGVLRADGVGLAVAARARRLRTLHASDDAVRTLERRQVQREQGPVVDVVAAGAPVLVADLRAAVGSRWPGLVSDGAVVPFRSSLSVPLRGAASAAGTLSFYRRRLPAFTAADATVAGSLGAILAAYLSAAARLQHREALAGQLQTALESRIVIEQAKGMLAERWQVSLEEAFERLRRYARSHNLRISDLAERVVRGDPPPVGPEDGQDPS